MATNTYDFQTEWRFAATPAEIEAILGDAPALMRWWQAVYLDVQVLETGDANGVGTVVTLYTKGWLPYTLRWSFRITEVVRPTRIALEAWGDLAGTGVWTIEPDGDYVRVTYAWSVRADKPLLRYFSLVMKPIFAANHQWAMAMGERSLHLELLRRRATTPAALAAIPPPPPPTFLWAIRR